MSQGQTWSPVRSACRCAASCRSRGRVAATPVGSSTGTRRSSYGVSPARSSAAGPPPGSAGGSRGSSGTAIRRPDATICLTSALAHYDLTDAIPRALDIALPRGSRLPSTEAAIAWHLFDRETFDLGRTEIEIPGSALRIGIYSPERCIADAFRLRGTTLERGTTSTRWRDHIDIVQWPAQYDIDKDDLRRSPEAVAEYRNVDLKPISPVVKGYGAIAQAKWAAWHRKEALRTVGAVQLRTRHRSSQGPRSPLENRTW